MNFGTQKGPSTHAIDATSCIKMWDSKYEEEELAHIYSYQALSADKKFWVAWWQLKTGCPIEEDYFKL